MTAAVLPPAKAHVWSDLPRRLTTIGIGVPIFWWLLQQTWTALTLFMGIHALAAFEYTQLLRQQPPTKTAPTAQKVPSSVLSSWWFFPILSLTMASVRDDALLHLVLVVTSALLFLWTETFVVDAYTQTVPDDDYHKRLYVHHLQGLVHVTLPFHAWYELCHQDTPYCHYHTISLLLIVWNCDNGALVCGRLLGKSSQSSSSPPPWLQRISPSKSTVGLVGGWLGGVLTTLWLPSFWAMIHSPSVRHEYDFYWDHVTLPHRLVVGAGLACLAVLGDLWESRLKRNFHTKDSGALLPGHGGVLDRFDSSFLAVLAYRYLTK